MQIKSSSHSFHRLHRILAIHFLLILLVPLACAPIVSFAPLTPPEVTPPVYGEVYKPFQQGPHPAIVLVHDSKGPNAPFIHSIGEKLTKEGYVVLAINYHAEKKPSQAIMRGLDVWRSWQEMVRNSVNYLNSDSSVQENRIGLIGFSEGATLAVSVAGSMPGVRAVVDYYGPNPDEKKMIFTYGGGKVDTLYYSRDTLSNMPPVQIHHGSIDPDTPVSVSKDLYQTLKDNGRTVEIHVYKGISKYFIDPRYKALYSPTAANESWKLTLAFLDKYVKPNK
jgi:dienelactone hydrolase